MRRDGLRAQNMVSYNNGSMKLITAISLLFLFLFAAPASLEAREISKMGIHILSTEELPAAKQLVSLPNTDNQWHYVTIPFTNEDVGRPEQWQQFFDDARNQRLIPIVRLATKVEGDYWVQPTRKNVVDQLNLLSSLSWPTENKHVIIFNEVNHAKEWGNEIDPKGYAQMFRFASSWARAIDSQFVVLPAAMDLAAPNGPITAEAFTYLNEMYIFDEEIFNYADAWNSHSYPNPGFASSPARKAKNALNGFEYELDYLKNKTDQDFKVYITETGWEQTYRLQRSLPSYYSFALQNVWSHPDVVAVTPFILQGSPGPFSGFSFLDESNRPTAQYRAFRSALEKLSEAHLLKLSAGPDLSSQQ